MDIVGLLRDSEFSAANSRFKAADEIELLREYAFEVTKALTGLTVGGSEFFKGQARLGFYEADISACVKNINWRMEARANLAAARARAEAVSTEKETSE